EQSNHFHNTLVDRIVPGYPKDDAATYEDQLDYEDPMMVVSETFLLWVIQGGEDLKQRIPFDQINEQILVVDDIQPYRLRKVRILNGGHTLMLAPAILAEKEIVKEAIVNRFKEIWKNEDYEVVSEQALNEKLFWDTDLTQVEGLKAAVAKALYEIDHNDMETAYKNFIQFYS
ncbi:MAG: hypothetical protein EOO18_08445, partial [Chryseobacterium sp.]